MARKLYRGAKPYSQQWLRNMATSQDRRTRRRLKQAAPPAWDKAKPTRPGGVLGPPPTRRLLPDVEAKQDSLAKRRTQRRQRNREDQRVTGGNRLRRFDDWSRPHKRRVLKRADVNLRQFNRLGPKGQRRELREALGGPGPDNKRASKGKGRGKGGGGRAERRDPRALTDPLTPKRLSREIKAATRLRYRPVQQEIRGQQRVSDQQQANIADWYGQYQQAVQQALAQTQQAQAGAQVQLTARQQAAQTADDAARGQLAPGVQGVDQQAAASRRALTDSFGAMLAAQGAAQIGYQADQGRIGKGDQVSQHMQEAARRRSLGSELEALAREKGDFRVQYRADMREKERRHNLERAAFGLQKKGFRLEKRTTKSKIRLDRAVARDLARDRRADRRMDRRKDARDRREDARDRREERGEVNKWGYTDKEWRGFTPARRQQIMDQVDERLESGGSGGSEKKARFTPLQKREARKDLRTAINLVRSNLNRKDPNYFDAIARELIQERDVDPAIVRTAIQYVRDGRISRNLKAQLRRDYGIGTPSRPPVTVDRPPTSRGPSGQQRPT